MSNIIETRHFAHSRIKGFYQRCIMKIRHERLKSIIKHAKLTSDRELHPKCGDEECIVVSLTSFPPRFNQMDLCLKSLFLQSVKPDHIVLWLGSDSLNTDYNDIFKKYTDLGMEIYVDEENNFKSHKKYVYAFEKYPNSLIITVDDDLVYPTDMIESLLKGHKQFPKAVIARRVHRITWDDKGRINPYFLWDGECESIKSPSHSLMATTGAGTLFPPNALYKDYKNPALFEVLAPSADDIWLKFMEILQGTKVVWTENDMKMPASLKSAHIDELAVGNCDNGGNDACLKRIILHYGLTRKDF